LRVLKGLRDTPQVKKTIFPKKFHGFFQGMTPLFATDDAVAK